MLITPSLPNSNSTPADLNALKAPSSKSIYTNLVCHIQTNHFSVLVQPLSSSSAVSTPLMVHAGTPACPVFQHNRALLMQQVDKQTSPHTRTFGESVSNTEGVVSPQDMLSKSVDRLILSTLNTPMMSLTPLQTQTPKTQTHKTQKDTNNTRTLEHSESSGIIGKSVSMAQKPKPKAVITPTAPTTSIVSATKLKASTLKSKSTSTGSVAMVIVTSNGNVTPRGSVTPRVGGREGRREERDKTEKEVKREGEQGQKRPQQPFPSKPKNKESVSVKTDNVDNVSHIKREDELIVVDSTSLPVDPYVSNNGNGHANEELNNNDDEDDDDDDDGNGDINADNSNNSDPQQTSKKKSKRKKRRVNTASKPSKSKSPTKPTVSKPPEPKTVRSSVDSSQSVGEKSMLPEPPLEPRPNVANGRAQARLRVVEKKKREETLRLKVENDKQAEKDSRARQRADSVDKEKNSKFNRAKIYMLNAVYQEYVEHQFQLYLDTQNNTGDGAQSHELLNFS